MNAPIPFFSLFFWNNGTVTKQTLSRELVINHIDFIREGGLKDLNLFTTILPDGSWLRVYPDPTEITLQNGPVIHTVNYHPATYYSAEMLENEHVGATD